MCGDPQSEMPELEKPHERIREASPDEHQDLTIAAYVGR